MIWHQKIKATKKDVDERETSYIAFQPACTQLNVNYLPKVSLNFSSIRTDSI